MESESRSRLWAVGFAAAITVALLLLVFVSDVVLLVLGGILFAIFLKHPSGWIARRLQVPYGVALAMLLLALVSSCAAMAILIGAQLVSQLESLAKQLPSVLAPILRWLRQDQLAQELFARGSTGGGQVGLDTKTLLVGAAGVGQALTGVVTGAVAVFFIGVYGAVQPRAYLNALARLVPSSHRSATREALEATGDVLARWILGRMVAMGFVGLFTGVGLSFLHLPLALGLGIIAGALTFVEYIGAVVSVIPAIFVVVGRGILDALWVTLLYASAHVVEGYLITPVITKRTVHFAPAFTLAMQLLFFSLFGVFGITLATPTFVIVAVLLKKLYLEPRDARQNGGS